MGFKLRALAVVGTLGIVGAVFASIGDESASMVRVIDGDTIVADFNGEEKKVRLLNVDTPELGRNGNESECLAEEARDFLREKLPPGTEIELRYDEEPQDRFGRELAAVYLADQMINAEIARQGFGVAVKFEPNDKYYWDVSRGENEATREGRGIHQSELECAVATQVETATTQSSTFTMVATSTLSTSELEVHIRGMKSHIGDLRQLLKLIKQPSEFAHEAYSGYAKERDQLEKLESKAERELENASDRLEKMIKKEAKKAEEEQHREQEKRENELREQKAQERTENQQQSRMPQQPVSAAPNPAPQSAPAAKPSAPAVNDGYTGCRAYAGNYALTSIDAKGRPYAKIDCTSKVQIG